MSNKPLSRLLETLGSNTQLFPDMPDDDQARQALLKSPQYRIASTIDGDFVELNQMLKSQDGKPAYLDEVMQAVVRLHAYLRGIQNAPDVGKAALKAAQERLKLNDADPVYALERISDGLPKPLDSMVSKLAKESWKVVLQSAIKHLEVLSLQSQGH